MARYTHLFRNVGTNLTIDELTTSQSTTATQTVLDALADKTDGYVFVDATKCGVTSDATLPALTRNAVGDYSLNRTAGGAENIFVFASMPLMIRTTTDKGWKIRDVYAIYQLGVVDATSVDMVLKQTTFANAVANSVADHGSTLSYNTSHDTAAERRASAGGSNPHVLAVTLSSQSYVNPLHRIIFPELQVVLANTGTFRFYGFAFNFTYDYL